MSAEENTDEKKAFGRGFGGISLGKLGESIRNQAEELSSKAAASVNELNAKAKQAAEKTTTPRSSAASNGEFAAGSSSVASSTPSSSASLSKTSENVTKEQLLDALHKLNKKVKVLSSVRVTLTERAEAAENDKARLLTLVKGEILNESDLVLDERKDEIQQLQEAWRAADERNSLALQELQSEYKVITMQCQAEVEKVKEVAEAETQAKLEKVRTDAIADGNEAWESMREQMVLKHQEDMNRLRVELTERHALERESLKEQLSSETTPFANGVASADQLEARHMDEIQKLKAAAARQLQMFKTKVQAARAAELENVKNEVMHSTKIEMEAKLEEISSAHRDEIASLKSQLAASSKTDYIEQRHREELERLRSELGSAHQQELKRLREEWNAAAEASQSETVGSKQVETAAAIEATYRKRMEDLREQHKIQVDELRTSLKKESSITMRGALEEAKQQFDSELHRVRRELCSTHETELSRVREESLRSATSELQQAQSLEREIEESDARRDEALKSAANAHLEELEALRIKLTEESAAASQASLEESEKQHENEMFSLREKLKAEHEQEMDRVLKELSTSTASFHSSQMEQLRRDLTVASEEQHQTEIRDITAAHDSQLEALRQQWKEENAADIQRAVEERDRVHRENEVRIKQELTVAHQGMVDNLRAELMAGADYARSQEVEELKGHLEAEIDRVRADEAKSLETQLEVARQETTDLTSAKILELEQTRVALMKDREDVQAKLETKSAELATAIEKMASMQVQHSEAISALTKSLEHAEQVVREREVELSSASEYNTQATHRYEELQAALGESERTVSEVRAASAESTSTVQEELSRTAGERDSLKAEVDRLLSDSEAREREHSGEINLLQNRLGAETQDLRRQLHILVSTTKDTAAIASDSKTMSDEVELLRQSLEEAQLRLESTENEHDEAMKTLSEKLRAEFKAELDKQTTTVKEQALTEKDSEITKLKTVYSSKLQSALKDKERVAGIATKVKAASEQKVGKLEKEHSELVARLQREMAELEERLKQDHLEELRAREVASSSAVEDMEAKMSTLVQNHAAALDRLEEEKTKSESKLRAEIASKVSSLQTELATARKQIENQQVSGVDELQKKFERHLKDLEVEHKSKLEQSEDTANRNLEKLAAQNESIVQAMKQIHQEELATLETEKSDVLAQLQTDFDHKQKELVDKHSEEMNKLKQRFAAHSDELKASFLDKMNAAQLEREQFKASLEAEISAKGTALQKLTDDLKMAMEKAALSEEAVVTLRNKLKSESVVQQALQKKLDASKKELDEAVATNSATLSSLLHEQENLKKEKDQLLSQTENLRRARDVNANKVEELTGKVNALTENLNAIAEERKNVETKLQQAAKQEADAKSTEGENSSLREQLNKLKLEQTKNASLIARLQAENDASERKHGQRTALVGMLEAQLSDLNEKNVESTAKLEAAMYDLSQKEEAINSLNDNLEDTERSLQKARVAQKQASESLSAATKNVDSKKAKMVESLQRELQSLQQQMARKSAAAQRLLQEREVECVELRNSNMALQQEVEKGSSSDRHIIELAAKQSNRETMVAGEIEIREQVVVTLRTALLARDGDLAAAEHTIQRVQEQVEELCRVRRREDVNLDYLKSIVVQFLSKPPGSSERAALLPVLATLLQFDHGDYKMIEEGKTKVSWWGSVSPTMIAPPPPPVAPPRVPPQQTEPLLRNTAEVQVSTLTSSEKDPSRRTSLQF